VSTLDPPGAAAATGPTAAAVAQAKAAETPVATRPRYALCTIGTNPY